MGAGASALKRARQGKSRQGGTRVGEKGRGAGGHKVLTIRGWVVVYVCVCERERESVCVCSGAGMFSLIRMCSLAECVFLLVCSFSRKCFLTPRMCSLTRFSRRSSKSFARCPKSYWPSSKRADLLSVLFKIIFS